MQDSTGVSNLFVLDLCDTANTQDPRDGHTSLITAVVDNNEVRTTMIRFIFRSTKHVSVSTTSSTVRLARVVLEGMEYMNVTPSPRIALVLSLSCRERVAISKAGIPPPRGGAFNPENMV